MIMFKPNDLHSKLIAVLQELLSYVVLSKDSLYSAVSISELEVFINDVIQELKEHRVLSQPSRSNLSRYIAPTGPLQEMSFENGWGEKFLELASSLDSITR